MQESPVCGGPPGHLRWYDDHSAPRHGPPGATRSKPRQPRPEGRIIAADMRLTKDRDAAGLSPAAGLSFANIVRAAEDWGIDTTGLSDGEIARAVGLERIRRLVVGP